MWNTILFDLDGTLTASAEGITKSVQYALHKMGKECNDLQDLMCFVGPPLKEQFMDYAGFSSEEAEDAVKYYRERYAVTGIFENRPFDGIVDMLQYLLEYGFTLAVASSKPTYFIRQILEEYHMNRFFSVVVGSELDGRRTNKAEVIEEALRQLGKSENRSTVLMVGDKSHDVFGAHQQQIPCIGVTFGYGSVGELQKAGADWLVGSVDELKELLLHMPQKKPILHPLGAQYQKENRWKMSWRCVYPVGIHFLGSLVAGFGASFLLTMLYILGFQIGNLGYYDALEQSSLAATGVGNLLVIPFLLWLYILDEKKRGLWKVKKPSLQVHTVVSVWIFAASISQCVSICITMFGMNELFPGYSEQIEMLMENQPIWLMLLSVGILAPIAEELVFRGLLFRRLREYANVKGAIIISSLVFGIYHGNMIQFIFASILGIIFAWLYEKTGRLCVPIMAHMAANSWSVLFSEVIGDGTDVDMIVAAVISVIMLAELVISLWGLSYFKKYRWQYSK